MRMTCQQCYMLQSVSVVRSSGWSQDLAVRGALVALTGVRIGGREGGDGLEPDNCRKEIEG